jgi:hypothetical protein
MNAFKTKFKEKYKYYKIDLNNPSDRLRDDLRAIPQALKHGYEVIEGDRFADTVTFAKGNIRVYAAREAIIRAEIINDKFCNQYIKLSYVIKSFGSYTEAFNEPDAETCCREGAE